MKMFTCLPFLQVIFQWLTASVVTYQQWNNNYFGGNTKIEYNTIYKVAIKPNNSKQEKMLCMKGSTIPTCMVKEWPNAISSLKNNLSTHLHPMPAHSHNCVLLLMSNLAHPEWISINCDEKLLPHIVCFAHNHSVPSIGEIMPQKSYCTGDAILVNNSCFYFLWHNISTRDEPKKICKTLKKEYFLLGTSSTDPFSIILQTTKYLLLKVLVRKQASRGEDFVRHYQRMWMNKIEISTRSVTEKETVMFACLSQPMEHRGFLGNVFLCKNGQTISSIFLYDNIDDCFDTINESQRSSDEVPSAESNEMISVMRETCFLFQPHNSSQHCVHFITTVVNSSFAPKEYFSCLDGSTIESKQLNDLVSDCGINAEDEKFFASILKNKSEKGNDLCQHLQQLSCEVGHTKCFFFKDICIYKLDSLGFITPCRTGTNLQECSLYECNVHFKCQNSYCIPWGYLCDGKWDCPFGHDESVKVGCNLSRVCHDMFRCRKSSICLHKSSICDGHGDCPEMDDEIFCELKNVRCPLKCLCINFALFCNDATLAHKNLHVLPFLYYQFKFVQFGSVFPLLQNGELRYVNISHCSLAHLCTKQIETFSLIVLDVAFNSISHLTLHCFSHLQNIALIRIAANYLSTIENGAFFNISTSFLLDLSFNQLHTLHKGIFVMIHGLNMLNLQGNLLVALETNMFEELKIKLVQATNYQTCCALATANRCLVERKWFQSCKRLLPQSALPYFFIFSSLGSFLVNIATLFKKLRSILSFHSEAKNKKAWNPGNILACTVVSGNMLGDVYLALIWAAHLHFGEHFALKDQLWKTSSMCWLAFSILVFLSLFQPAVLLIIGLSRFMVAKYPILSKFKSTSFVLKIIVTTFVCLFIGSAFFVIISKMLGKSINNNLCLPSVDLARYSLVPLIYTCFIATAQNFVFLVVSILANWLVTLVKLSKKRVDDNQQITRKMFWKLISIIFLKAIYWQLINAVLFGMHFAKSFPLVMIFWTLAIVMPLHSMTDIVILVLL